MNELFEIQFKQEPGGPIDNPEYLVMAENAEKAIEKLRKYLKTEYQLKFLNTKFIGHGSLAQKIEDEFQRIDALQLHRLIGRGNAIC